MSNFVRTWLFRLKQLWTHVVMTDRRWANLHSNLSFFKRSNYLLDYICQRRPTARWWIFMENDMIRDFFFKKQNLFLKIYRPYFLLLATATRLSVEGWGKLLPSNSALRLASEDDVTPTPMTSSPFWLAVYFATGLSILYPSLWVL